MSLFTALWRIFRIVPSTKNDTTYSSFFRKDVTDVMILKILGENYAAIARDAALC